MAVVFEFANGGLYPNAHEIPGSSPIIKASFPVLNLTSK